MALQDLTPELRTRLRRVERWVGLFVAVAAFLLLFGLAYYVYQVAQRKGWFLEKAPYHTYVRDAAGLRVGDPVKLMGFDVGEITEIEAMPPAQYFNIYLQFRVKEPYFGYLWADSRVKIGSSDFLGNRYLEVTKGTWGAQTVQLNEGKIVGLLDYQIKTNINHVPIEDFNYVSPTNGAKGYWLSAQESPALTERLDQVITSVEKALPNFLSLTNDISGALSNVANITRHADELLLGAQPVLTNLTAISRNLTEPKGSLGEWLFPTNISQGLAETLATANTTLGGTRTNLDVLTSNLVVSLENVANLTSNLNAQVQANGLVLSELSSLVVNADDLIQGLKRHWLLKGSFDESPTNQPFNSIVQPRIGETP